MKHLPILALILALASCATPPPRAILPPKTEIGKVDTAPVESATVRVSDGAEKVAEANRKAREASNKASDTTVQLRAAIDRAKVLAEGNEALRQAFLAADELAEQLSEQLNQGIAALREAETESNLLRDGIKSLSSEVSTLKASAAVNASQTETIQAENKTLREQVEVLAALPDKLAKTEQKADTLEWWVWRLGVLSVALFLIIGGLAYLLLKP